jgi:hypothetical protein
MLHVKDTCLYSHPKLAVRRSLGNVEASLSGFVGRRCDVVRLGAMAAAD